MGVESEAGMTSKVIERVKKMLALAANNPSAEEAAVAAAKAQALIEQHSIDIALLHASEKPDEAKLREVAERVLYAFRGRTLTHWILDLCQGVKSATGLYGWTGYRRGRRVYEAAGPMETLIGAEVLIDWLVREVDSLWAAHKKTGEYADERVLGNVGRSYTNSFRMGCASEISHRLYVAADEQLADAKRRASMSRDEAYTLAMEEGDTDTLASLDSGEKRYGLAVVQKAFELVAQQKVENKEVARKKHKFVSSGSYGGSCGGSGWSSGVAAGKRAKISAPGRIR